ncbi:MAG: hypothetical protein OXI70_00640 [Chloroflexota bacterium]|nr:hypothetical protein [Chloroflexota bacterium]
MRSPPAARRLSRRRVLGSASAAAAALTLAACGDPIVVERVVVVPKIVEREVVIERPVITERAVIVEREVVVTRLITPPPTPSPTPRPTFVSPEQTPQPARPTLRAALSPALVRKGEPELTTADLPFDLTLETLDAGADSPARLLARAAAGELPDLLIGLPGGLVTALDVLDELTPLDAALSMEPEILPEMLALGRRERGLMGLPVSGYSTYLLAGRRRLDLAGVAEVGSNYEALAETARRLTDAETYAYGLGVIAGLPELETVAGSAGTFPTDEAAADAWQWYADLWLHEGLSPPPSAWDGQGAAGEAVLDGRVALTVAHGRALSQLAALPPERQAEWETRPLPSWPEAERRIPMAAAFVAAGQADDGTAADAAVALAGLASRLAVGQATPALTPALDDWATRLGLERDSALEARDAWRTPIVETPEWHTRTSDLDTAVHRSLVLGSPASEVLVEVQARQARARLTSG